MIGGIDDEGKERMPFEDIVKKEIIKEYGEAKEPLKIVAITDGARDIRTRLLAIFGILVTIILDWYHLCKKVRELMSMIARNKEEKMTHMRELFYYLWRGMADKAIEYLKKEVTARNKQKLTELITYLEKHKTEIMGWFTLV
jgi:succinate dehydrogenase flavin-adding protein (antitoxin of CptAB toxin-antitoxin module)